MGFVPWGEKAVRGVATSFWGVLGGCPMEVGIYRRYFPSFVGFPYSHQSGVWRVVSKKKVLAETSSLSFLPFVLEELKKKVGRAKKWICKKKVSKRIQQRPHHLHLAHSSPTQMGKWTDAAAALSLAGLATAVVIAQIHNHSKKSRRSFDFDVPCPPVKWTRRKVIMGLCFVAWPVTFVGGFFHVASHPEFWKALLPPLFSATSYAAAGVSKVLPLHASSFMEAFELGQVFRMANSTAATKEAIEEALKRAAAIAQRVVSLEELRDIPRLLGEQDASKGLMARVVSFFSIVNLIWFLSLLGLTVLFVPCLYVVAKPVAQFLATVWTNVVKPFLWRTRFVYEPLFYFASLFVFVESLRYPSNDPHSMSGSMIGLTSVAMTVLSWFYTTYLHSNNSGNVRLFTCITSSLVALVSMPVAVMHNSSLVGYLTVSAALSALGFSAWSSGMCTMIGFENESQFIQTCAACLGVTLTNAALRFAGVEPWCLEPFKSAVGVLGSSVYFLCADIATFWVLRDNRRKAHALMIGSLVSYIVLGEMLYIPGMSNSAKSWMGVYLLTLFCSYCPKQNSMFVVFLFSLCGIMFGGSLYLNRHPSLVTNLLSV